MEDWIYIQVILPLRLPWEPFYKTDEKDIMPGMRVCVPFAGRRYTAVVSSVNVKPAVDTSRILEIAGIERHLDIIGEKEILLWRFMAEYYLCTIGEVYKLAYPAFKTAGEKVCAGMEERKAAAAAKELDTFEKRLVRLQGRMDAKEADLMKKHGDKVRSSLEESLFKIKGEILEVKSRIEVLRSGNCSCSPSRLSKVCRITADIPESNLSRSAMKAFAAGRNVLLEAGSSRMEVMISAAAATIAEGRDVLLLVPEIELSRSLQSALTAYFGDSVMVFHSGISAVSRREAASALRNEAGPHFVLGTKSALFLPFRKLGLIIVDEENDPAYKHEGSPRFIARDTAVMLGGIHGAEVLLCSPSPSLESLYNCISGRYVHVPGERNGNGIEIVDTSREKRKGGMLGQWSRILIRQVQESMEKGESALILRPWGPFDDLKGEMEAILPEVDQNGCLTYCSLYEARRMDLNRFGLLAVIGADVLLDRQDFRADEKAMQILEHFRSAFNGRMLVQTGKGSHPVFSRDPEYRTQLLAERKAFNYPPYSRMVDIVITDQNGPRMKKLSIALCGLLRAFVPIGPYTPLKGKEPEEGKAVIRIMLPKDKSLKVGKKNIADTVSDFEKDSNYHGHIIIDVDPV